MDKEIAIKLKAGSYFSGFLNHVLARNVSSVEEENVYALHIDFKSISTILCQNLVCTDIRKHTERSKSGPSVYRLLPPLKLYLAYQTSLPLCA